MKLFLASEVKHPLTIKKLEKYIGGFKGKKIAYIPTAANGEGWGCWKEGGSWKLAQTLDAEVTLLQLEDYFNKDVIGELEGKDIIWFTGGQPGYLMYWVRRTQIDKHIKRILADGALYLGSSAGSMIASKDLKITQWYIGENEYGASVIPGLGLVDFDIYPHYQADLLGQIKRHYKGKRLYLLKDGEEIIVEGKKITVVGKERVVAERK